MGKTLFPKSSHALDVIRANEEVVEEEEVEGEEKGEYRSGE